MLPSCVKKYVPGKPETSSFFSHSKVLSHDLYTHQCNTSPAEPLRALPMDVPCVVLGNHVDARSQHSRSGHNVGTCLCL